MKQIKNVSLRTLYAKRSKFSFLISAILLIPIFILVLIIYNIQDGYSETSKQDYYKQYESELREEIREKNNELKEDGESKHYYFDRDLFDKEFPTHFWLHRHKLTIIVSIASFFLFSLFVTYRFRDEPFICKHCLKSILPKMLIPFKCPFCDTENNLFSNLIKKCKECGSAIPAVDCPHCKKQIDLLEPYDVERLEKKRYGKKI